MVVRRLSQGEGSMQKVKHLPKIPKTNWREYRPHEREPDSYRLYNLSPEIERELLEHSLILKHRVWRSMKRLNRHKITSDRSRRLARLKRSDQGQYLLTD